MTVPQLDWIPAQGVATYAANQQVQWTGESLIAPFVPQMVRGGQIQRPRVLGLLFEADIAVLNGGSTQTLAARQLARIIDQFRLKDSFGDIDVLTQQAGKSLADIQLFQNGRQEPTQSAGLSCTGSATTTSTVRWIRQFTDFSLDADIATQNAPMLKSLVGATISVWWPTGGVFGSDLSLTAASTIKCTPLVQYTDGLFVPARFCLLDIQPTAMNTSNAGLDGTLPAYLAIKSLNSAANTARTFSPTNLNKIDLTLGGVNILQQTPVNSRVRTFNSSPKVFSTVDDTTMDFVPLDWSTRNKGRNNLLSLEPGQFKTNISGTAAATEFMFTAGFYRPQDSISALAKFSKMGFSIDPKSLRPKLGGGRRSRIDPQSEQFVGWTADELKV